MSPEHLIAKVIPCFCSFKVAVLCLSKDKELPSGIFVRSFFYLFYAFFPLPYSVCDAALTFGVWFNQQKFIFSPLWKLKSKIKVSARLVSSEDSLLDL